MTSPMTQTSTATWTMRQQMAATLEDLLDRDERLVVLLANISTELFDRAWRVHPNRIYDLGILEQTLVSAAAGFALEGMIPVVHSIAPFAVERCFEQIKDDFIYQRLGGNIISTGASYDYSASGMTHHAPGDVAVLKSLPNMQIVVPGTPAEFDALLHAAYANGATTYFRMSIRANSADRPVRFGRGEIVREGSRATIVAVGPALEPTLAAANDLDVTVLYYTTVAPFDAETLRAHAQSGHVVLIEPFYTGTLVPDVVAALDPHPVRVTSIGVPRQALTHYGTREQHDAEIGFTPEGIRERIVRTLDLRAE